MLVKTLPGMMSEATFYRVKSVSILATKIVGKHLDTYEICEMDVTIRVQKNIIWLDITVYDALTMYISQSAPQLRDPKPHCLLRKSLS